MRVESPSQAVLDELATPVLWLDAAGAIAGANVAATDWLGVGLRRLLGLSAGSLERDGALLAASLA